MNAKSNVYIWIYLYTVYISSKWASSLSPVLCVILEPLSHKTMEIKHHVGLIQIFSCQQTCFLSRMNFMFF